MAGLVAASCWPPAVYSVLWIRRAVLPPEGFRLGPSFRREPLLFPASSSGPAPAAVARELNLGHKLRSIFQARPAPLPARRCRPSPGHPRRARRPGRRVRPRVPIQLRQRRHAHARPRRPRSPQRPARQAAGALPAAFPGHLRPAPRTPPPPARLPGRRQHRGLWVDAHTTDGGTTLDALRRAIGPFLSSAGEGFHPVWNERRVGAVLRENLYRRGRRNDRGHSAGALRRPRREAGGGDRPAREPGHAQGLPPGRHQDHLHSDMLICAFDHFCCPSSSPPRAPPPRRSRRPAARWK